MSLALRVPGAVRLPGRARSDVGAVTVEAAISLLALAAAVAVLMWGVGLLGAQLALGEASRAAARAAARGEGAASVTAEAQRLAPAAEVRIRGGGGRIEVEVVRVVTPPGLLGRLGSFRLASVATAAVEPVVEGAP